MIAKLPLSVFIIAHNEADRIGQTIASVIEWVDEVIVIDSGSADGTPETAAELGARVLHNDWPGYGPQKRYGEDQCRNDWLLNLDADEVVTPNLRDEIVSLMEAGSHEDAGGWRIMIRDVYPHEDGPAPWAYGYHQIRLYDRRQGRFSVSSVHDTVRPDAGTVIKSLKNIISHRSIRSLDFQVSKYNRYSNMQVTDYRKSGRKLPKWRLLTEFPFAFFKAYFIRRYRKYGWWGVILAINYAHARFLRLAKVHEADLRDKNNRF